MKEFFYYFRDKERKPVVTVCLIQHDQRLTRGVAVCSDKDIPNKQRGRAIAKGRAIQALMRKPQANGHICRGEASKVIDRCSFDIPPYKSMFDTLPTDFERKMIGSDG